MKDASHGFEPCSSASKAGVLPLDEEAVKMEICATNPTNLIVKSEGLCTYFHLT